MVDDCFRDYTILILILIGDSSSTNTRTMTAEQIECLVDFCAFRDTKNFNFFGDSSANTKAMTLSAELEDFPGAPVRKLAFSWGSHNSNFTMVYGCLWYANNYS